MIETLARKRTNAVALAVIVALVAAMFVVLPNVGAVDNTNDRTPEAFGACVLDSGAGETNYLLVGDTCTIDTTENDVYTSSDATIVAGGTAAAGSTTTLTALAVGSVTITDTNDAADATANDDTTIKIEVLAAPTVSITFDDTDATVKAGTTVVATVTTRGFSANHTVTVSVPSTGLLFTDVSNDADDSPDADTHGGGFTAIPTGVTTALLVTSAADGSDWAVPGADPDFAVSGLSATVTIRTTGVPDGEYPISASVESQDADVDTAGESATPATDIVIQKASTTATLTIGDAGAGLASATLALGTRTGSTAEETGTDKAGSDGINLVIESFNSLGAKANGRDVNTIIVSAIGSSSIAIGSNTSSQGALTVTESSATSNDVGQKHTVTVNKSTPGTVDVTATVIGASGVAMTETITLTFSGNPETHSVAAPADALAQENDVYVPAVEGREGSAEGVTPVVTAIEAKDAVEGGLKFEVTGSDDAGNQSALTTAQITARVLDADDKNVSSKFKITEEIKENSNGVVIIRVGTGAAKLDAGTYTLETKLTGKDTQETEFGVSGAAAEVSLEISVTPDPLELGSLVNVTATVTDGNGTPVADGTEVDFATGGSLTLDKVGSVENVKTDDGVAKARFIVSKGDGLATIIADAGSATGVATVYLAGAGAMADRGPSLGDLSGTSGLVSYSGPDTTASELMALLAGRASAIWLSNNGSWVLYSMVDGAMVPGSVDFTVTSGDVLYISG